MADNRVSTVVGVIQMGGGVLEIALGTGAMAVPTGFSQVGGVILIAHGADTIVAGFRSLYSGKVETTLLQQGATWAAEQAGASNKTAQYVGIGTDLVAGVGPSVGIAITRRLAIAGATRASEQVTIAYLGRGAFEMGHNVVGIRQGGTTAWVHFAGVPTGEVIPAMAPDARYVLTGLAVGSEQAASATATRQLLVAAGPQAWGYVGPNCTTTALDIIRSAGIIVPEWSRSPFLLHLGLNAGAEITIIGGSAAAFGSGERSPTPNTTNRDQSGRHHKDRHLLIHGHHYRHVVHPTVLPPKG